jgi:hypothetical protein
MEPLEAVEALEDPLLSVLLSEYPEALANILLPDLQKILKPALQNGKYSVRKFEPKQQYCETPVQCKNIVC